MLLILRYNFSFYRYGYHRDLHSFPTRRSSDLTRANDRRRLASRRNQEQLRRQGWFLQSRDRHLHARSDREDAGNAEDRKSTRLNSSHMSISYAVFCLKKKKRRKRHKKTMK